jgi:hypothetical protein
MNKIIKAVVVGFVCVGGVFVVEAKSTYRDAMGRKQGTAEVDRYGKTTYRDAQGRITGTSSTDRYGKTTYRDAQGRIQGSKK